MDLKRAAALLILLGVAFVENHSVAALERLGDATNALTPALSGPRR
jgi:hypothetical protein